MAKLSDITKFHGEKTDEIPENFWRDFEIATEAKPDQYKIKWFENVLDASGPADKWWRDIMDRNAVLFTWNEVDTAFHDKWPRQRRVKKSKNDCLHEMEKDTLVVSKLMEKEQVVGVDVWTHVAWADRQLKRATSANIAASDDHIYTIRGLLPEVIQEKIASEPGDWRIFTSEVKAVSQVHIEEGVKKANILREMAEKLDRMEKEKEKEKEQKKGETPRSYVLRTQFENFSTTNRNHPDKRTEVKDYLCHQVDHMEW